MCFAAVLTHSSTDPSLLGFLHWCACCFSTYDISHWLLIIEVHHITPLFPTVQVCRQQFGCRFGLFANRSKHSLTLLTSCRDVHQASLIPAMTPVSKLLIVSLMSPVYQQESNFMSVKWMAVNSQALKYSVFQNTWHQLMKYNLHPRTVSAHVCDIRGSSCSSQANYSLLNDFFFL